jgi:hypothetical protein
MMPCCRYAAQATFRGGAHSARVHAPSYPPYHRPWTLVTVPALNGENEWGPIRGEPVGSALYFMAGSAVASAAPPYFSLIRVAISSA